MLKGQAKKDYQREYMRDWQRKRRGSKQGLNTSVRPSKEADAIAGAILADLKRRGRSCDGVKVVMQAPIYIDADGNPVYE